MLLVGLVGAAMASSVGVGLGASLDLPDATPVELKTSFWPAPSLFVPVRVDLAPRAALRFDVTGTFAIGRDLVSWEQPGLDTYADQIRTLTGMAALGVGPEIRFTEGGPAVPYVAGSVGLVLVHNAHSQMWDHAQLFDPAEYDEEDLSSRSTFDPWARTVVPATNLAVGVHLRRVFVEGAYDMAYVSAARLQRGTPELKPMRVGYHWNALRLAFGVTFPTNQPPPPPP